MNKKKFDEKSKAILLDYQIEATCRLGDWDQLASLLENNLHHKKNDEHFIVIDDDDNEASIALKEPVVFQGNYSWGAQTASLISALKHEKEKLFTIRIDNVRRLLMETVLAMTIENSAAHYYSQVYEYIVRYNLLYYVN